ARCRPQRRASSSRPSPSRSHRSTFRSCTAGRRGPRPDHSALSRESDRHPAESIEPAVATRRWFGSRRSDELLIDDRLAEIDALVADENAILARDQLPDLVLSLPAEGAAVVGHSAHLQRTSMFSAASLDWVRGRRSIQTPSDLTTFEKPPATLADHGEGSGAT